MVQTMGATGSTGPAALGATGATGAAAAPKDSGKYRLLAPHVISDTWLPIGTEVGTDTPYRYPGTPSTQMEGLDDAGKAAVDKLFQDHYGVKPPWESDDPTAKAQLAQYEADPDTEKKEAASEPVSLEQAFERGTKEYQGKPVPARMPPSPVPQSISGDRSIYVGTARMV